MKRILSACLSVLVLVCFFTSIPARAVSFTPNFEIRSKAAMLINLDTDTVLYQKNAEAKYGPGSLVQIMAAIVVLENCSDLRTNITADSALYTYFTNTEFADDVRLADIKDGDVLSVEELLYAMLLTSSCEASVLLANHFGGGSIEAFVEMMNNKATEIGCTNTHFTNVTGMHSAAQTTTAQDLAIMTKYALSVGRFKQIATSASFSPYTPNPDRHEADWTWLHSNTMTQESSSFYMEGVSGIKTANLSNQGRSIICQASRDGNTYLAILLAAPFENSEGELMYYHLNDASALFKWVFEHFTYQTILSETTELGQVKVENGEGSDYVLVKPEHAYMTLWYEMADAASVVPVVELPESVSAPVKAGEKLGTVTLKFSGEVIETIDLVATSDVKLSTFKYYLAVIQHFPKTPWLMTAILVSLLLCAIYIALCIYSHIYHKQRLKPIEPVHLRPNASAVKREAGRANNAARKKRPPQSAQGRRPSGTSQRPAQRSQRPARPQSGRPVRPDRPERAERPARVNRDMSINIPDGSEDEM